jgi:hypothetical protein
MGYVNTIRSRKTQEHLAERRTMLRKTGHRSIISILAGFMPNYQHRPLFEDFGE